MEYRDLQKALSVFKKRGLTQIKLTAKASVLQAEYNRLCQEGLADSTESGTLSAPAEANRSAAGSVKQTSKVNTQLPSKLRNDIQVDPEVAAAVAESWTDNAELATATIAAYSVAGLAMVVLWIVLIATTLVISALKSWYWCRKQFADLSLQLKYFEPPIEVAALTQSPVKISVPVRPLLIH